jgi:hypothetical protein
MKSISKQLARDYVKDPLNEKIAKQVASAKRFDVGAAEVLALCTNPLSLWSLERLSEDDARALALHKGGGLLLEGLPTISDEAAKSLAQYSGRIYLGGLKKLSTIGAAYLAGHPDIHFPFELRPEAAQGLLEAVGLKHTSKRVAIKSKKLKSLQIALPLEKRPLHLLQQHPEFLHLVSEQMIPGALGEQKSELNRALLQGLGSYLAAPVKPCMSFHFPPPDAVRDLLTDDWDESEAALGEWAEKELGATHTFYVDVEDITEGCGTAVGFSKHVFPKCCVTEDELCSKDTLVLWRSIGAEFTITSVSFESEDCEVDQWEVPPHELSDLFNRALPPEHTMVYFDMGANGLYVLMETKGMERRLSNVLNDQTSARPRKSTEGEDNAPESEIDTEGLDSLKALFALDPDAEVFTRSVEDLAGEHAFGRTFAPGQGVRLRLNHISVRDAEVLASFPAEILEVSVQTPIPDDVARILARFSGSELRIWGVSDLSETAVRALLSSKRSCLEIAAVGRSLSEEDKDKRIISLDVPLPDACIKKITTFKSDRLFLNGITDLSDANALSLSAFKGEILCLRGVTKLSEAGARALAACRCEEIHLNGLKDMSSAAAAALGNRRCRVLQLNGLERISDTAAEALSASKRKDVVLTSTTLSLDGIKQLSEASALSLSKVRVFHLSLCGLKNISDKGLGNLAQFDGALSIGIEHLSAFAASSFGAVRRNSLHLIGLTDISAAAIASLASSVDSSLTLNGIQNLSIPIAEVLARCSLWSLSLKGFESLSVSAAKVLADSSCSNLSLGDLKTVSPAVAAELANFKGELYLDGIERLDTAVAEVLAKHKGLSLHLNGVRVLSDAAAKVIAKHEGNALQLNGVELLSDAAAKALAKHEGDLGLSGLQSLSETAARYLSKHEGRIWPSPSEPIWQQICEYF